MVKASPMKVTIKLPRGGRLEYLNTGGFVIGDEVRYYTDATGKYIRKLLPLEVARVQEMLGGNESLQTAIREDSHAETSTDQGFDPEELFGTLGRDPGEYAPDWPYLNDHSYSDDQLLRAHSRSDDREEGGETPDISLYVSHES